MKENHYIDKIFMVVTVLLAVLLVFLFRFQKQKEYEKTMYLVEYNQNIDTLAKEKTQLQTELGTLQTEYQNKYAGKATISLIFTDLDNIVYEEIWPEMKGFQMNGVLLLSKEQFPGTEGCMSMQVFRKMIAEGWEYCLEWDGEEPLQGWLTQMEAMLKENNLEMPTTLYFQDGTYQKEYAKVLKNHGISSAVHHGEGEEPIIAVDFEEDTVWYPGAYPFHVQGGKTHVETCIREKGSMAFSIGNRSEEEKYTRSSLISMLEQLQEWVDNERLQIMTVSEAYEYRVQLAESAKQDVEMTGQIEALEKQIEDVELGIQEIREQYRAENGK